MLDKVDKTFLENAINEPISEFTISEGSKAGDNVAGNLKAVRITTIKGKTLNLVMKVVSEDPEQKNYAKMSGIYAVEGAVYNLVNPRIKKLMESKGISDGGLPIPRFFGSGYNAQNPDEDYLLLEDVRPEGYIMPNKFKPLNLPQVSLIMKELAKFHAKSYFWLKQEGEKVFDENEDIKRMRDSFFNQEDILVAWAEYFSLNIVNAVEILKEKGQPELAERVQKRLLDFEPLAGTKCMRKIHQILKDGRAFPCIIHGDIWGNNVMIKNDKDGNPEALKFLDFQLTRRGTIFDDLGYFFMCSTDPEFRKNHLFQCLNVYFESFEGTLNQLKTPLPLGFSRGVLIDIFYELWLSYFAHTLFAIPLQLGLPIPEKKGGESQEGGGPPDGMDPSKMTPEDMAAMMKVQFEMRRKELLELTIKSPPAVEKLIAVTKEAVDAGLL